MGNVDGGIRHTAVHELDRHERLVRGRVLAARAATTIYGVHDGYGPPDPLLDRLGPHTTGKGCLYIKRLNEVDQDVLTAMIRTAWDRAPRSG